MKLNEAEVGQDAKIEEMRIEELEHLEWAECTYSQRGIHCLRFRTNTGRELWSRGTAGKGLYKREINLRPHNKAIIGIRGLFAARDITEAKGELRGESILLDLYLYVAVRLDLITNSDPIQ